MIWTRSLRWLWVGIGVCLLIGVVVVLIISGTHVASGELWDVDRASDLEIGTEQQQVITNIEVLASDEPVKIHVGSLVDSGAEFDYDDTSYRISTGENTNDSQVYIQNPKSSNATIIVSASAISSPGRFDLHIDNIDTTNVSRYDESRSRINRDITYTAEQGGKKAIVGFSILSPASVELDSNSYDQSTRSIFYSYSANGSMNINTSVTIWERKESGDIGKKIKTVDASNKNISIKNTSIEGETELVLGLHSSPNEHGFNAIYDLDSEIVNVSVPVQLVGEPFYYQNYKNRTKPSNSLLLEFNTNISSARGYVTTSFHTGNVSKVYLKNNTENYQVDGDLLYVYPHPKVNSSNQAIQPEIDNISLNNITSTSSNVTLSKQVNSPIRIGNLISDDDKYTINRGSNLGLLLDPQYKYKIVSRGRDSVKQIDSNGLSYTHRVRTNELSSGYYLLTSSSGPQNVTTLL